MDSSHLEKMSKELKCPICLSLLNSAVSLTCNHVFCNLCIDKSMKSASDCPICKLPFRRREVCPAPHMDNLVNIYKSMEVASGLSISVTQPAPSKTLHGGESQHEGDEAGDKCQIHSYTIDPQNKGKFKGNRSKVYSNRNSSSDAVRPSFPTKKRVQVPEHPLSETLTQPIRLGINLGEQTTNEPRRSSVVQEDNPLLDKKGNLDFGPFFWLQEDEEDADKCTPHTACDNIMYTPPNVPCFSDIKDSDDESPCNMTPNSGPVMSQTADLFDCEMFEWTQRACSPELFSSPTKMQVKEIDRHNEMVEKTTAEDIAKHMEDELYNGESVQKKTVEEMAALGYPDLKYTRNNRRAARLKKRSKKASGGDEKKPANPREINNAPSDVAADIVQIEKVYNVGNPGSSSHFEENSNKQANKACLSPSATATVPTDDSTSADGVKYLNENSSHMPVVDLSASFDYKDGSCRGKQNKRRKRTTGTCIDPEELSEQNILKRDWGNVSNPINTSNLCKPKRSIQKVCRDPCDAMTPAGNVSTPMDGVKPMHPGDRTMSSVDGFISVNSKEDISRGQKLKSSGKHGNTNAPLGRDCSRRSKPRKLNTASDDIVHQKVTDLGSGGVIDSKSCKKLKHSKKVTFGPADSSKVIAPNDCQNIHNNAKETQSSGKLSDDSPNIVPVMSGILRKWEKRPNNIQCSFCHSLEDSEASGVMVHYLKGKPVNVDYNGGYNCIHVHRNCAEWAPNVYFEDDVAINLEAELTRSKRIKCGCCGLKGAALGCYEKSCRRSFHVPCAKLTPQCRWDDVNFVMLCPLHASSKLPNEISGIQSKQKEKLLSRRQVPILQTKSVDKQDDNTRCQWNSHGLSAKLVLCCSALTIAEKETISKFEMLSGVKVLKSWDTSVTHVIASTDENGACRRTLKFLMGILEGKWILNIEWVEACLDAREKLDEHRYEINVDIHGISHGPRQGRLRHLHKQPKLFDGYKFYFIGDFQSSYRGYLHDLVTAAGGTVLHRKPILGDDEAVSSTFIIYSLELLDKCNPNRRNLIVNQRRSDAENLASSCQAVVATNSWILNSIAACKLQNLA